MASLRNRPITSTPDKARTDKVQANAIDQNRGGAYSSIVLKTPSHASTHWHPGASKHLGRKQELAQRVCAGKWGLRSEGENNRRSQRLKIPQHTSVEEEMLRRAASRGRRRGGGGEVTTGPRPRGTSAQLAKKSSRERRKRKMRTVPECLALRKRRTPVVCDPPPPPPSPQLPGKRGLPSRFTWQQRP